MLPDLATLLEEFERLTLDEQAFFSLEGEEGAAIDVLFLKNTFPSWEIIDKQDKSFRQKITRQQVPDALYSLGVDCEALTSELAGNLLTQAACADEMVRQISKLLGTETVQRSISETQEFMESLKKAIESTLDKKAGERKAKLKVIKS